MATSAPLSSASTTPTPASDPHRFLPDGTDLGPLSRQRLTRYYNLLPIPRLTRTPVHIVGCGAIGRQVALSLTAMGVENLILQDHDTVAGVNLGTQGWSPSQLDLKKTEALTADLKRINPEVNLLTVDTRFRNGSRLGLGQSAAIFACVDNMDVRKQIFEAWDQHTSAPNPHYSTPFFDARMGAECCHIFSVYDPRSAEKYAASLFPQSEAEPLPCTARATLYCAAIAANLLVAQYIQVLRGRLPDPHLTLNVPAMELFVP